VFVELNILHSLSTFQQENHLIVNISSRELASEEQATRRNYLSILNIKRGRGKSTVLFIVSWSKPLQAK